MNLRLRKGKLNTKPDQFKRVSMGLTVNRQKWRLVLTVKKFQGISILTISANLHRISELDKPVPVVAETLSLATLKP